MEYLGFKVSQNIGRSIYINTLKNKALNNPIIHIKWRLLGNYLKIKDYFVKILLSLRIVFGIILTGVGVYAKFTLSEGC
jgi:hypothetical protein